MCEVYRVRWQVDIPTNRNFLYVHSKITLPDSLVCGYWSWVTKLSYSASDSIRAGTHILLLTLTCSQLFSCSVVSTVSCLLRSHQDTSMACTSLLLFPSYFKSPSLPTSLPHFPYPIPHSSPPPPHLPPCSHSVHSEALATAATWGVWWPYKHLPWDTCALHIGHDQQGPPSDQFLPHPRQCQQKVRWQWQWLPKEECTVCVCICVCMIVYVCMCVYVFVCAYVCVYVCVCVCKCVCICMCVYIYVCMCVCVCVNVYPFVCVCIYVCMCVCVYVWN